MNNSSNKDQHYALDSSGNIRHIKDANPSNDEFFCLFCHRQMIAKQGKIRQWHFAHKALSPNCSYESYLHSLAKLLILQNSEVNNLSESKLKFRSLVKIKRPAYGTKIHLMNLATGLDTKIMI